MTSYAVYASDPFGTRLADCSNFISLKYSRVVNGISTTTLTLPGNFDTSLLRIPDGRLEIWRHLDSGREYLDTDTVWLIKRITQKIDGRGLTSIVVEADTPLCVLREPGRFVNFATGTSQADKAATFADNQIKAYVKDAIGSTAGATRDLTSFITIAGNLSAAASIAKAAAWRDVLKVCQELADASTQTGTYLAFDVVAPTPATLEFRTYTGQRGVDHRYPGGNNPVILSPDMGNLGETELTIDYRDEVTYALAGGKGDGSARLTASAQDTSRIGASPFGLREHFVTATQYGDTAGLSDQAAAAVRAGRPRTIFRGKVLDTQDTQYGVHWGWGDYLTAQAFGVSLDCRVEAITISVQAGGSYETIDAWVKSNS